MNPLRWRRKRLQRLLPNEHGPVRMVYWDAVDCPGCGLPVYFERTQTANVCGWCYRDVTRAVG